MSFAKSPTGRLTVKTRGNQGTVKKVKLISPDNKGRHPGELGAAAGTHTVSKYQDKRQKKRGYKKTPGKPKKVRPGASKTGNASTTANVESPDSPLRFSLASPSGASSFESPSGSLFASPSGSLFASPSGVSPAIKKKRGNTGGRRKTKRRKRRKTKRKTRRRKRRTKKRGRKSRRRR